jgi:hypothetical protein
VPADLGLECMLFEDLEIEVIAGHALIGYVAGAVA